MLWWYTIIAMIVLVVVLVVRLSFLYKSYLEENTISFVEQVGNNVMFVVAHPDDECLFFGSAITALTNPSGTDSKKKAKGIYLLCLSDGNADGLGYLRREELKKSCRILGIPENNAILHSQSPIFEDGKKILWDPQLVADTIQLYVKKLKINSIVTFDEEGITGHLNHKSVFCGAQQFNVNTSNKTSDAVQIYILESVVWWRRYIGFLDAIFINPAYLVATADWQTRGTIQRAMASHASQYNWLRRLNVIFSRYLFMNTLLLLKTD